jgi:hypothetical protein
MDRFLHLWLEVLNAHAQAIESQASQGLQVGPIRHARINLNSNFGVRRK